MIKENQEKVLKLLNHQCKLIAALEKLQEQIQDTHNKIGDGKSVVEMTDEFRKNYPAISKKLGDKKQFATVKIRDQFLDKESFYVHKKVTPIVLELSGSVKKPKE